jgi:hypothetical protein
MVDLDPLLRPWVGKDSAAAASMGWDEDQAAALARRIASASGLDIQWEPGDEEWILFLRDGRHEGMLSVRYPVAVGVPSLVAALTSSDSRLSVAEIDDFLSEELRASPELLRATVLDQGWDPDFDTERFSANDLFVESV